MAKKLSEFLVFSGMGNKNGNVNSSFPVSPSNVDSILMVLLDDIKKNKPKDFTLHLSENFIYPELVKSYSTANDMLHGDWTQAKYEYYYTRPTIEVLLFEYPSLLLQVVNELVNKDQRELYDAFIYSLDKTEINKLTLFSWSEVVEVSVRHGLNELFLYGSKLAAKEIEKGNTIKALHKSLNEMLSTMKNDSLQELKDLFKNLQFKLAFAEKLHSKDAELAEHRGWKKYVGNLLLALFSVGVLHLAHRLYYGNWLFFNDTSSKKKVSNIQNQLGFERDACHPCIIDNLQNQG